MSFDEKHYTFQQFIRRLSIDIYVVKGKDETVKHSKLLCKSKTGINQVENKMAKSEHE